MKFIHLSDLMAQYQISKMIMSCRIQQIFSIYTKFQLEE